MPDFEFSVRKLLLILVVVLVLVPAFYIGVGEFLGTVNNTPLTVQVPAGESHIVATTARLIERELDSGFCPSAVLWPGHIRYDVCGFQEGEQQILQRTVMQLSDHLTREGPTSDRDPNLNTVLANVSRPNTWSLLFSANNTASLLGKAVASLDNYNQQLKIGKAGFYPRIDNLSLLLGDVTSILGGEAKLLQEKSTNTGLYSMQARKAYFHTLGTMAASCWILQAARQDFDEVLKLQSAEEIFDQATQGVCAKLGKDPLIVINGDDLSHLLTLSGAASAAVNNLSSVQTALAAAHNIPR